MYGCDNCTAVRVYILHVTEMDKKTDSNDQFCYMYFNHNLKEVLVLDLGGQTSIYCFYFLFKPW